MLLRGDAGQPQGGGDGVDELQRRGEAARVHRVHAWVRVRVGVRVRVRVRGRGRGRARARVRARVCLTLTRGMRWQYA